MSKYYSPFTKLNGEYIDIKNLQHRHLSQLSEKEIEEGYKVEFKGEFSDSVKKKLPKIITSFANSEGGWLLIGIDEKTHSIDLLQKQPRTDYSQQISQLLREHVSPLPKFETRFLSKKSCNNGVLVVYVYESDTPPHVANGTVYIRNGSSSESPKPANRAEIDNLVEKADKQKERFEKFCHREIFYPMDGMNSTQVALLNIFLFNTNCTEYSYSAYEMDKNAKRFLEIEPNQFQSYMFSGHSIVFRNWNKLDIKLVGACLEMFNDYSARIHIPIPFLTSNYKKKVAEQIIEECAKQENVKEYLLFDGYLACKAIHYFVQQYFTFLRQNEIEIDEYAYKVILENGQNGILYFDTDAYREYISHNAVPVCCKKTVETVAVYYPQSKKNDKTDFLTLLLDLLALFGIPPTEGGNWYIEGIRNEVPSK